MTRRMKSLISRQWRSMRDEAGSVTLEGAIVMPILAAALLALLLIALYIYQSAVVFYQASVAAERSAFRWDNSYRSSTIGSAPLGEYDGLYWRIQEDGLLQHILGIEPAAAAQSLELPIGKGATLPSASLAQAKLAKGAQRVAASLAGELRYEHQVAVRSVEARLLQPLQIRISLFGRERKVAAQVSSVIVEPVEFLRVMGVAQYYFRKFGFGQDGELQRQEAGRILLGQS